MNNIKVPKTLLLAISIIPFVAITAKAENSAFIEPTMVTIPAGDFIMGGSKAKELPTHKVAISSFNLAKYEVTVKEFRQFVQETGHKTKDACWIWQEVTDAHNWGINVHKGSWQSPKYAPSEDHPVMCVTWQDANDYAAWLSKKTNKDYRLPTEAEWEYAARAGTKTTYYFGNDANLLCEYGNVLDQQGSKALARDYKVYREGVSCNDGAEYTNKVGEYKPNAFGLYDMIGNVGEFVMDCEHVTYAGAPSDGSAWTSGCNKERYMIVVRGGAYGASANPTRSGAKAHAGPNNPSSLGEGFRLAETIKLSD